MTKPIQDTPQRTRFLELWDALGVSAATIADVLGYKSRNVPYYWRSGIYPPPKAALNALAVIARSPKRVAKLRALDAERQTRITAIHADNARRQAESMTADQRRERAVKGHAALVASGNYRKRAGILKGGRHEACRDCFGAIKAQEMKNLEKLGRAAKLGFKTFYYGSYWVENKKCWAYTSKRTGETYYFVADEHK